MSKKWLLALLASVLVAAPAMAYETHTGPTGVVKHDKAASYNGYTLFSTLNNKTTYLIDNDGNVVHTWKSKYIPGLYSELLPNGNLIRAGQYVPASERDIYPSGAGGIIEIMDWDGNVVWEYVLSTKDTLQHHGYSMMENGNLLIMAAENVSTADMVAAGRKPDSFKAYTTKDQASGKELVYDKFILDYVVEVTPDKKVVWEWHAKDHIGTGPDQLDPNYILPKAIGAFGANFDWTHWNTVHEVPGKDQVIINSRNFSEFYIVDKKTNKMVLRWGNPSASGQGKAPSWYDNGDQKVWGLHNPHFLDNGNVLLFDNGSERPTGMRSAVVEVNPETGTIAWEYTSRTPNSFWSFRQSSAQKLPNGNVLVTSTAHGHLFEVTPDKKVVWEFINPVNKEEFMCVIEDETPVQNQIHRAYRYGPDFPGLKGKDLSPKGKLAKGCPDWTELLVQPAAK